MIERNLNSSVEYKQTQIIYYLWWQAETANIFINHLIPIQMSHQMELFAQFCPCSEDNYSFQESVNKDI